MIEVLIERRAVLIIGLVSVSYAIGISVLMAQYAGMDFSVYWRAAHQNAVEAYASRRYLPFPYPPTMLAWVAPLAFVPFWFAYPGFMLASLLAFGVAARGHLSLLQLLLAVISPPIVNAVSVGQCSIALAAALLWACATPKRAMAGIALGLIASVKPQLVIMAPLFLLIRRDWPAFISAGFTYAAMLSASVALFGVGAWENWYSSLPRFQAILASKDRLGMAISPALVAENVQLPAWPFWVAGIVLGLWLVWIARRSNPLTQCAAIACASLLAAPYAMFYDLAAVVPFLIVEIWAGSILAMLAVSGAVAPISLLLTTARFLSRDGLGADRATAPVQTEFRGEPRAIRIRQRRRA